MLFIPSLVGAYTTKTGDTLQSIATANSTTTSALISLNPSILLLVGQNLVTSYATTSQLCYNYGHQPLKNGQYDMVQVASDISYMKSHGVTCLRLAYLGLNSSLENNLGLYLKNQGFSIQIGSDGWFNNNNGVMTKALFPTYDAGIIAQAKFAQTNGIQEIGIGNEQEYRLSGITINEWIAHVKALSYQVRQVYNGKIIYATSGDFTSNWISQGALGYLDALGLNLYCGSGCNSNYLSMAINAFGKTHVEITETNCDIPYQPSCKTDSGLASEVKIDALKLLNFGVPTYFFAYRSGGAGTPTYWQVLNYPQTMKALGL